MHVFVINKALWRACLLEKLTINGFIHLLSMRYFNKIRFGNCIDRSYLDKYNDKSGTTT